MGFWQRQRGNSERLENSRLAMNVCPDICRTKDSFLTLPAFVNFSDEKKSFVFKGRETHCSVSFVLYLKGTVLIFISENLWKDYEL